MTMGNDEKRPPPPTPTDHRLPGTGIAGRKARATNLVENDSDTDDPTSIRESNMTFMEALKAKSAPSTHPSNSSVKAASQPPVLGHVHPFHPARFLSSRNKSPHTLQRIGANPSDIIPKRTVSLSLSQPIPTQSGLLTPDLITNNSTSNSSRSVSMAVICEHGGDEKDDSQLDIPLVTSASSCVRQPSRMKTLIRLLVPLRL
jgi:hypothetical protein